MSAINFEQLIEQLQSWITQFGLRAIAAIAIFIIGRWVAKLLQRITKRVLIQARVNPTLISFTANLTYYGIIAVVILAALGQLGIQTTSLVAILGAAGLAIGLALQGSLSNFAAGILIVVFHPFQVGDWISSEGVSGIVEDIQLFTTMVRTFDNKIIIVPNSNLTSKNITNYSTKGILRVDLEIGIAYEEDIDRVKQVLLDVLTSDERVLAEPAPTVGLLKFGDSSLNFAVRPWTQADNYWAVYFSTMEAIKKRLDAEGIKIPFPQRDIHIQPRSSDTSNHQNHSNNRNAPNLILEE